jgi:hypothetical protein
MQPLEKNARQEKSEGLNLQSVKQPEGMQNLIADARKREYSIQHLKFHLQ